MFPLNFETVRTIKHEKIRTTIYGPDPHDNRWGWTIVVSDTGAIIFDTGFVYASIELVYDDIKLLLDQAHSMVFADYYPQ
jgi:hypothetical protein